MGDKEEAVTEVDYDLATKKEKKGMAATKRPPMPEPSKSGMGLDKNVQDEPKRVQQRTIFGADTRVLVTNLPYYPWRTVCKLFMTFPSGKKYIGSGILIAPKYVLTAGHCVYWQADGGWANSIEVVPAYDGSYSPSYRPFGTAWAAYYHTYTGWTSYQSWDHDFALIRLDRRIGDSTGWLGYGNFTSNVGVTGHTAGYPGDKNYGQRQYYTYGPISSETSYQVKFYTDIMKGQSGSGIWRVPSTGGRYVFAVVSWESPTTNGGCRLNSSKVSSINSWMALSP
jgi:V8-like Glu-specific endopeptidase